MTSIEDAKRKTREDFNRLSLNDRERAADNGWLDTLIDQIAATAREETLKEVTAIMEGEEHKPAVSRRNIFAILDALSSNSGRSTYKWDEATEAAAKAVGDDLRSQEEDRNP